MKKNILLLSVFVLSILVTACKKSDSVTPAISIKNGKGIVKIDGKEIDVTYVNCNNFGTKTYSFDFGTGKDYLGFYNLVDGNNTVKNIEVENYSFATDIIGVGTYLSTSYYAKTSGAVVSFKNKVISGNNITFGEVVKNQWTGKTITLEGFSCNCP